MNYEEAEIIVKESGAYASPDFYRMQEAKSIALGLTDAPIRILADVTNHGSPEALARLTYCIERGYVVTTELGEFTYYNIVENDDTKCQFSRSHMAMQIAYPALYWDFFDGEEVWSQHHPKMLHLVELCISCLTNKLHPSDFYGQHEIVEEKQKVGRPKAAPKVKEEKVLSGKFKTWVEACQAYNTELARAWDNYLQACVERKAAEHVGKAWRDGEIARIEKEYAAGMKNYSDIVDAAKQYHSNLKAQGKPKRDKFE